MPEPTDKLTQFEDARREALELIVEGQLESRAEIVRPAIGNKMTPQQEEAAHRMFEGDQMLASATFDELQARFQLKPSAPIPLRFVYRAILSRRAIEKTDRANAVKAATNGHALDEGSLTAALEADGLDRRT